MLKRIATWWGVVFLIIGVLGFISFLAPGGMLFGLFAVDGVHNTVHLLTGAVALWAGVTSERASRLYFQIFAVIYGLVVILGLFYGNAPLLGIMAHNWADVWLHVAITAVAAYVGYVYAPRHRETAHPVGH